MTDLEARASDVLPLAETSHSRESLLDALRNQQELPSGPVAVATLYVHEIEPDILDVLGRASLADLDLPAGRLLFRGLHILGGRRRTAGFPALVSFLRGPQDRVDDLLGDSVTGTLPRILAGMFDGKAELLFGLITDRRADQFVRGAAMGALGFLVFESRIEKQVGAKFLQEFDAMRPAEPGDFVWYAWMVNVALLGMHELTENVKRAFADERIAADFVSKEFFAELLADAPHADRIAERFEDENLGYIDDVLVALQGFTFEEAGVGRDLSAWQPPPASFVPVRNPLRQIGRNDPCPCGSGKKFKKCCLASGA